MFFEKEIAPMKLAIVFLCILITPLLLACGGGGSSSTPVPTPIDPPVSPPEPPTNPPLESAANAFSCGSGGASVTADEAPGSYALFESSAVRPLALSSDGSRLVVINMPANCLEIYQLNDEGFVFESSVMVGMEPVAVALLNDNEAWVVNQLSDSVSIVDLQGTPTVRQTLQVGDEPRDIVFAGPERGRAFITASYRGQNHPGFKVDDLLTAGLGRADVWVYDASAVDQSLNGGPLAIINLFADTPRALAVSPDGTTVYASAFMSGNQTTTVAIDVVQGAKPAPLINIDGLRAPDTGLIVKKSGAAWLDEDGTDWASGIRLDLPDSDLFLIDAMAETPAQIEHISGVGSTLFNMAVNPVSEQVYVSNLEALNHIRFEGPGEGATTVRGHIAESRITVLAGNQLTINHLNPHIDFDVPEGSSYSAQEVSRSLSQPVNMVISPDGETLYLAAYGSAKVAAIATNELHNDNYVPNASLHINLPGGGPSGLMLSADGSRLMVYTRFDNALSLWDTSNGQMIDHRLLFTPESEVIIAGRPFLYDATLSSANGTSACSSCHIFGDMDQLAWDLGNPEGSAQTNANEYVATSPKTTFAFHPMKGPMTTQTLRGIADSGPQHWRGDRAGQNPAMVKGELESIEAASFKEFNPAFVGLVGREEELSSEQMQAFTDFSLAIVPPPNPVRNLNNRLSPEQANGEDIYFNVGNITGIGSCNDCHTLNPLQNQFGTSGLMSFEGEGVSENFKVPHIRNAYAKVGMFGSSGRLNNGGHQGDQIKGFGYLHDGAIASLFDFFDSPTFNFPEPVVSNQQDIVRFVMAADSNFAPIVGQQVTVSSVSSQQALERLALLEQRAQVDSPRPECDLIVRGQLDGLRYSAMLQPPGLYLDTDGNQRSSDQLLALARSEGNVITASCVTPDSGRRLALDGP
ncbi:MAG: DNA-binding beta-propeller fold protein YncE [Alcanivorax sp.]|jgi:DNA-binding beta-propeller fold protein YncE